MSRKEKIDLFYTEQEALYNVDVVWKGEQPNEWSEFEVFPETPNHIFS